MSEQEQQGDGGLYTTPDVYQSQSGQDIYQTPDTDGGSTGGIFSGGQQTENAFEVVQDVGDGSQADGKGVYENNAYGSGQTADGSYDIVKYEEKPLHDQNGNDSYGNGQYGSNAYGSGSNGNMPYGNNQYINDPYGKSPYENGSNGYAPYGGGQYENNSYGNGQFGNNPYGNGQNGNQQYGNANASYGNNQYGSNQYGNSQYGNSQYGNASYGSGQYGGSPYGGAYGQPPYGNGQYSPYAAPPGKKHTGLIIGIIVTVAVLFLIALFALFYHAFEVMSEKRMSEKLIDYTQEHEYDIDEFLDRDEPDDDYRYDDDYYPDYDDDEYYTLHDDIKKLSYSINWEYFEYEADNENVSIIVDYPEISGSHVPNLEKINSVIANEISVFTDYYEEEYSKYMNNSDSYFNAYASGYVTYMSEDVLSVVFSETVYTNYYNSAYLYCINIDMRDGVILENTDIISVDDDFSVDFRYRSDEQNGTIDGVDRMSDQEITELLTSDSSLIIFYTPQGMEIGFNYDEGWVTVTYHDYRNYLKIF